jgi:hypothetical protein
MLVQELLHFPQQVVGGMQSPEVREQLPPYKASSGNVEIQGSSSQMQMCVLPQIEPYVMQRTQDQCAKSPSKATLLTVTFQTAELSVALLNYGLPGWLLRCLDMKASGKQ